MACAFPIKVQVKNAQGERIAINSPCGRCLCCRQQKQTQLKFLAERELIDNYMRYQSSSFVTLTYREDCVPIRCRFKYGSTVFHGLEEMEVFCNRVGNDPVFDVVDWHYTLEKVAMQKFMKRFRINYKRDTGKDLKFKYIACGEYGEKNGRCHYHIAMLGVDPALVRKYASKSWKYGIMQCDSLSLGGIRYITKYITKGNCSPEVRALYEQFDCEKEFLVHSCGLGKDWILRNLESLLEDPFIYTHSGRIPLPKHVLNYLQNFDPDIKRRVFSQVAMAVKGAAYRSQLRVDQYLEEQAYLRECHLAHQALSSGTAVSLKSLHCKAPMRPTGVASKLAVMAAL